MRIAFVDKTGFDYRVDAPEVAPFGGSHSAMIYLARELAALGHEIGIYTLGKLTSSANGVTVRPWPSGTAAAHFAGTDVLISLNGTRPERIATFERVFRPEVARVLWPTVDTDQPPVFGLAEPAVRDWWDAFAMLSEWASQKYQRVYGVDAGRCQVFRYAVAPAFEGLFSASAPILPEKATTPILAQTSAPFRGLSVLIDAFPRIRRAEPDARLRVYSGQATYQVAAEKDPFAPLYDRCRATEGVDYIGGLPQPQLAAALRDAWILAYPCTFDETSCIAVMEAAAAGCDVVTVRKAALPETLGGFARCIAPAPRERLAAVFAEAAIDAIRARRADPLGAEQRLQAQVSWILGVGTWRDRARDWDDALTDLCAHARRRR
jgi:glycosyltransferase involved in cell wall biosynthesis